MVSIILATYNERGSISGLISQILSRLGDSVEIIVVDDDSPDGTWMLVSEIESKQVKLVRRVETRGLASAIMRGVIESKGDIVGWLDADGSMPVETLVEMLNELNNFDIVIGSRYTEGGNDDRSPLRVLSSKLLNGLARMVLNDAVSDYTSGFIVMHRRVLDKVIPVPEGYGEYFIDFIYRCLEKGFSVKEVGYEFSERTKGASKSNPDLVSFAGLGMKYIFRIIRTRQGGRR